MKHPTVDTKNPHSLDVVIRVWDVGTVRDIPVRAAYKFPFYGFTWAVTPFYLGEDRFHSHKWTLTETSSGSKIGFVTAKTVYETIFKAVCFLNETSRTVVESFVKRRMEEINAAMRR